MKPLVDETIRALSQVEFRDDPIAGRKYARATSIVSSAYMRYGKIIERALFERLRQNNRLSVWTDAAFSVSPAADNAFSTSSFDDCLLSELPYGASKCTLQIDLVVFDEVDRGLRAYEKDSQPISILGARKEVR